LSGAALGACFLDVVSERLGGSDLATAWPAHAAALAEEVALVERRLTRPACLLAAGLLGLHRGAAVAHEHAHLGVGPRLADPTTSGPSAVTAWVPCAVSAVLQAAGRSRIGAL